MIGSQIGDLELIAAQNDWELDEKRTRRDGTRTGEIVSTEPAPGERLEKGGTLVVVVSEGNELTDVPAGLVGPAAHRGGRPSSSRRGLTHDVSSTRCSTRRSPPAT